MTRVLCLVFFFAVVGALVAANNNGEDSNQSKKEQPKFDPAKLEPIRLRGSPKAPEFADIEAWINSEPLTMAKLKGKVVVVHFMAFG